MASGSSSQHDSLMGIPLILGSVALMTLADALIKSMSDGISVWVIFWGRAVVAIPLLLAAAALFKWRLRPVRFGWVMVRNASLALNWLLYYASLPFFDFSFVAVILYLGPSIITILAAVFLREPTGWQQWLGTALGFAAIVVIVGPGKVEITPLLLLPLGGAFFYALAMVLTRSHCQGEAPAAIALVLQGQFLAIGIAASVLMPAGTPWAEAMPFVFAPPSWPEAQDWTLLIILGVLSVIYFMGVARAYQVTRAATVAVFDYAYMAFALLWGVVLLSETPGPTTYIGLVMMTTAGILASRRPKSVSATS